LILVEKEPASAHAQLLLGRAYALHADSVAGGSPLSRSVGELLLRDAETACGKAIELGSNDPQVFSLLAQLLQRRGDSEQALQVLERGLAAAGPSAALLVPQADLLGKKGDQERSLAAARAAAELAPDRFDAQLALTSALERSGAADQALESACK